MDRFDTARWKETQRGTRKLWVETIIWKPYLQQAQTRNRLTGATGRKQKIKNFEQGGALKDKSSGVVLAMCVSTSTKNGLFLESQSWKIAWRE
jgi:hypothetical protein